MLDVVKRSKSYSSSEDETLGKALKKASMKHLRANYTRFVNDSIELEELKGKELALIVGITGCGKSTTTNAIVSGVDNMFTSEKGVRFVKNPVMYNGNVQFKTGNNITSKTATPHFFPLQRERRRVVKYSDDSYFK